MKYNKNLFLLLFFFIFGSFEEDCTNWDDKYKCESNDNFKIEDSWDERGFQTPPRNDIYHRYRPSYQDMHYIVGYAQLKYSSDKNIATLKFITKVNPILGEEGKDYYINYHFGNVIQRNNTIILTSANDKFPDGMPISAKIMDMKKNIELVKLELDDQYFIWDNPIINQPPQFENGQKGGIVELFGWPYEDIALECEFLSHAGYMGLKVYSPNEHLLTYDLEEGGVLNPWWYINQPVSYKFNSRMGNQKQLKKMINTCRKYNLRIYADIIINHMTGSGNDMYDDHRSGDSYNCAHWGEKTSSGGSPFWTVGFRYENNTYTGLEPGLEYPSVPFFPSDFHCVSDITNWGESSELDGGWIVGLADLNTEKENVQQRIADYYVDLLSIGFSGFSMPNSKHIFPKSHAIIFQKLKNNLGGIFPDDFIAILQLNYGGEKSILMCEETKRSSFGDFFVERLKEHELTDDDIEKIKIWNSGFPQESPNCDGIWKIVPERHAISIENPDDINLNSYYNVYIKDKNINIHRSRTINMFASTENNWKIKSVFSMFSLINNSNGFPDGKSDCKKCKGEICKRYCSKSFPYQKAYDPLSIGYDPGNNGNWKEGTYTRVHRDLEIINSMRTWMNLSIMNDEELYYGERLRANCSKECLICNDESKSKNMCLICNKSLGFYPVIYPGYEQKYFECLNSSLKFERIYFNETEEAFKPCYESCRECNMEGNGENHNCLKCDVDLIERPGSSSYLKNCVVNCTYKYNMTSYGQYKCVEIAHCINGNKNYIKEKNICIDECKNDEKYRYSYKGICLESCPTNTEENDYICYNKNNNENNEYKTLEVITNTIDKNSENFLSDFYNYSNSDICTFSEKLIQNINFQDKDGGINEIVQNYKNQFYYTNKHILQLTNTRYNILIYKDNTCIDELSLQFPKIDFGVCYEKAKENSNTKDNLIVVYAEKMGISNPNSTYSLYNPESGKKIDGESLCEQDWIIIEKNISFFNNKKINNNLELARMLYEQGINIFNSSDPFFQDICFHFESPIKKDITLKDRILSFYPDITLCDPECEFKGVNLTTMMCICICRFNDIVNNDLIKDNFLIDDTINEIIEFKSNSNLDVLTCYNYCFKYINKSIGGFIILASILICIIFTIIFYLRDINKIIYYIKKLTEDYLNYIAEKSTIADNNKNEIIAEKNNELIFAQNNKIKLPKIKRSIKNKPKIDIDLDDKKTNNIYNKRNDNFGLGRNEMSSKDVIIHKKGNEKDNKIVELNSKKENSIKSVYNNEFFIEYLATSVDDYDFEDSMEKDNRSFFEYLCDSIIDKQLIVNTFYSNDPLRPISIKIILFNINIILYFIVNGIFYGEDYISDIYHTENEEFFTFFPRSISRIVYTTFINIIICLFIDLFFIEEKKIKRIFNREKENIGKLKLQISLLIKQIKKRYFAFIIVVFILLIFFWYYLICFNYVYPYTQIDWIKSSIVIILFAQILSFLSSILEAILRYMSFFCKSEKLFRVSKLLE